MLSILRKNLLRKKAFYISLNNYFGFTIIFEIKLIVNNEFLSISCLVKPVLKSKEYIRIESEVLIFIICRFQSNNKKIVKLALMILQCLICIKPMGALGNLEVNLNDDVKKIEHL
jgi:hypothetical protein